MASENFQFETDIQWTDAAPKIQRQLYGYNDQVMMVKVRFEQGGVGAVHQHPHTQVTYVESGVFEMTIGDEKKIISKGDGYFVPPDVLHGCVCLEAGMLVDCFAPMREDFV
ncbi:MAG: cupin domain-containing protein [Chitinophagaceae bacterium]|nr:MAG: cupin domain-containing protein [Chitinophagaceae bacterium]